MPYYGNYIAKRPMFIGWGNMQAQGCK